MTHINLLLVALVVITSFIGCDGSQARRPPPSDQPDNKLPPVEEATAAIEIDPEQQPAAERPDTEPPDTEPAAVADLSHLPLQPMNTPQEPAAAAPTSSRHRFVLMARGGPLIVDLLLSVGGQPLDGILDRLVDQLLKVGDSDEDGRLTWQELLADEKIRKEYANQFNLPNVSDEAQRNQLTRRYDTNRNGTADRDEIPRLFSQAAAAARPFTLSGSNYYREFNRYQSETIRHLDQNRNGKLESAEITGAPQQLRTRDFDHDQHLTLTEFGGRAGTMDNAEFPKNELDGDVACLATSEEKLDILRYTLRELYVDGDELAPNSFGLTPALFGQLDIDENDQLDQTELASISDVPAHIAITIDLGTHPFNVMKITTIDPQISDQVVTMEKTGWVRIKLPTTTINFFLRDPQQFNRANNRVLALLASGDKDQDAQVTPEEFDAIEWPENLSELDFDMLDQDNSGSIDQAETIYYANRQPTALGGQVHCRVRHDPDAMFAELDNNADARLNPRELRLAAHCLKKLDTNQDNLVDIDEVPDAISIGIWRGNRDPMPGLFSNTSGEEPQDDRPTWFSAMDINRDGEIGRPEFLGRPEQFQQIDANTDGYLTIEEVEALTSETVE